MTGMVIVIIHISFIHGLLRKLVVFVKFTLIFYQTWAIHQEKKDARARLTSLLALGHLLFFVNRFSTINQKRNETARADELFHFKY